VPLKTILPGFYTFPYNMPFRLPPQKKRDLIFTIIPFIKVA
jgi:hypothetical protein